MSVESIIAVIAALVGPLVFKFLPLKDAQMRFALGGIALLIAIVAEMGAGNLSLPHDVSDPAKLLSALVPVVLALYGAWRIAYEILSAKAPALVK